MLNYPKIKKSLGPVLLAVCLLASVPSVGAAAPAASPAGSPASTDQKPGDIIVQGKLSCPLKRLVIAPFRGVLTAVKARAGQKVKEGEVLAQYRLFPDVVIQLRRRLSPPQIHDLEAQIAGIDQNLSSMEVKKRELQGLSAENMAPAQSLSQVEKEIQLAFRNRSAIDARLKLEQQLAKDDLSVLKDQLGKSINPGNVPEQVSLVSPIAGYVIGEGADVREGAEVGPGEPAFVIGVMDPMVVRAQVHEMEAIHIGLGDKATISLDSLPGKTFEGTVSRLSWMPISPGVDQPSYYEMELTVPNPDLALKDGLKGQIDIRRPK